MNESPTAAAPNTPRSGVDTNNRSSGAVVVRLADVRSEKISWLWPRRLPRGKVVVLCGDPGVGKSFIFIDVTARLTCGRAWPDGGPALPAQNVLFMAVEDGLADTMRPRLERAGADLERVHNFTAVRDQHGVRLPDLKHDLTILEAEIIQHHPAAVVIDPVNSYLGEVDSYKDTDLRRVLVPLAVLAEKHNVCIVALIHLTKGQDRPALYRALGSVAFVGVARIVLAAGTDPDDPERRYLMPVKQNVCKAAATLAYRLLPDPDDPEDGPALLEWEAAPVEGVDANDILGAQAATDPDRPNAAEFLTQLLADGRMRAEEVYQAGGTHSYSRSTLNRAKRRAGVRSYKEGFNPSVWYWERVAT